MSDFDWTGDRCADSIRSAQQVAIHGGEVSVGSSAWVREGTQTLAHLAGSRVTVKEIAIGFMGRAPFQKRKWVALRVVDKSGGQYGALATELRVAANDDTI